MARLSLIPGQLLQPTAPQVWHSGLAHLGRGRLERLIYRGGNRGNPKPPFLSLRLHTRCKFQGQLSAQPGLVLYQRHGSSYFRRVQTQLAEGVAYYLFRFGSSMVGVLSEHP
jgi:hypothetical protein